MITMTSQSHGVSVRNARGLIILVSVLLFARSCSALPADTDRTKHSAPSPHASSGQALLARRDMKTWTLIRDLEEAVFNLKEHLLSMDARSSSHHHSDVDVVDPLPEKVDEVDRHLEDSYPEVTAELQDKRELNALESNDKKPTGKGEDMSLKEALQYLVTLAKEKKKEATRDQHVPPASHH